MVSTTQFNNGAMKQVGIGLLSKAIFLPTLSKSSKKLHVKSRFRVRYLIISLIPNRKVFVIRVLLYSYSSRYFFLLSFKTFGVFFVLPFLFVENEKNRAISSSCIKDFFNFSIFLPIQVVNSNEEFKFLSIMLITVRADDQVQKGYLRISCLILMK